MDIPKEWFQALCVVGKSINSEDHEWCNIQREQLARGILVKKRGGRRGRAARGKVHD
jgi:hypothetical protein